MSDFDDATQEAVRRGQRAWESLRNGESWENWITVGRAIEAGRNAIMRILHTNVPKGKAYNTHFTPFLTETGFDKIDAAVRTRLQKCLDNLPDIEQWRSGIGLGRRLELNHPTAVWRAYEKANKVPEEPPGDSDDDDTDADTESLTRPKTLKEANVWLQNKVDAQERVIKRLEANDDRGPQVTVHDRPEDIARVILEWLPLSKRHPVASAMMRALKSTAPSTTRRARAQAEVD